MRAAERSVVAFATVVLMILAIGLATIEGRQQQPPAPIQGQLEKVDTTAMTLSVKTAEGKTVNFGYTKDTQVMGAENGIAGLAKTKEARVTVHFTEKAETRTATRIEVQPAK